MSRSGEAAAEALLAVDDLVVQYGAALAVDGVSLTVDAGERVALIGPNGAGKTSLLNAICGLLRPARGRVRIDGRDVTGGPPSRVVALGITQAPEGRQVFPTLSVESNLVLGALGRTLEGRIVSGLARWFAARAETRHRLERVYELLPKLYELRARPAGKTSGGEQQMTSIGRALMARPRLLAIDELSLGLAPLIVQGLTEFLADLNAAEGVAILLIEQNAQLALDFCPRAYVLEAGRLQRAGSSADLARNDEMRRAYLGGLEPVTT